MTPDLDAMRSRWPDHPWFAPGGPFAAATKLRLGEGPREGEEWVPSAEAPPHPAYPDPLALAVDLCPFREGCQSCGKVKCLQAGYPAIVTPADCRACQSGPPPSPEPLP